MNLREWALPVYTTLMHISVGILFVLWILRGIAFSKYSKAEVDKMLDRPLLVVFITVLCAMIGSHLHLSKPFFSFLALLNLRNSWLSREVVMTILFFFSLAWLLDLQFGRKPNERLRTIVGWVAITLGLGAIYCMAQIYRLPTQIAWDNFNMVLSFFLDTFMLGVMALSLLLIMDVTYSRLRGFGYVDTQSQVIQHALPWLALAAIILGGLILAENAFQMSFLQLTNNSTAQASLQLIKRIYPVLYILRIVLILVGASGLVAAIAWKIRWVKSIGDLLAPAYITCLLVMIGAILGRFLFYATHVRIGI